MVRVRGEERKCCVALRVGEGVGVCSVTVTVTVTAVADDFSNVTREPSLVGCWCVGGVRGESVVCVWVMFV